MGSPVNWEDFFRVPGSAPLLRKTEVAAATLAVLWEESRQTRQSHHGKKDECLICQVPCNTVLLSKNTNSNIQTFFLGIDGLCKKYSQETSQISEFQDKHRRRLVAFYREKISQLEESLRKSVLQIKRLQSMRSSQQAAFNTIKTSVTTKPNGYPLLPPNSSLPDRLESMEIDLTPPARKPEMAAGPSRISLISPPQDGRMGSVSCRGTQQLSLTPSHASMTSAISSSLCLCMRSVAGGVEASSLTVPHKVLHRSSGVVYGYGIPTLRTYLSLSHTFLCGQSSTIADALQGTIASSRVTAIQQSSRRAFSQC
ncbi:probable E3 SUMO-protein ligase RNF212 isoform X3 [Cricetulus griseus]|uniref:Probable E3 SUMO-protein ligase RNF212 isoform X3 n=1 Tax=Cricetulus griseus TaxID=10029 RepID=A0A9J7H3A3_CRIGR|nr:probable E3 SUMO-protein ligase RNF212 isoform X3 [Cricetulus griseus]